MHPPNADSPILITPLPIETCVIFRHPLKAYPAILVTELGMVILEISKLCGYCTAPADMLVTSSGIVTSVAPLRSINVRAPSSIVNIGSAFNCVTTNANAIARIAIILLAIFLTPLTPLRLIHIRLAALGAEKKSGVPYIFMFYTRHRQKPTNKHGQKTRHVDLPRSASHIFDLLVENWRFSYRAKYARLRTLHGLGCPPHAHSTPLHPKRGIHGRLFCPTGMSKNIALQLEEH